MLLSPHAPLFVSPACATRVPSVQIELSGPTATAMGSYVFTCLTTGEETRVEYTFGYKRCADGKVRICLHHSSVPYTP